ncbi:MAG: aminopeptidase [Burkholderiaceae bacterium]|nr:aminopeptidase [Burkholderiaceae bacterium]
MASLAAIAAAAASALCLSGCGTVGYYWQSVSGQVKLMNDSRPVTDWLADDATSPKLKERLALSQRIRSYAVAELKLPDNASYHRYADLKRPAVVWNVVAAPEYSLKLKTWCFPVVGCVGYRGYFDEAAARAEADRVKGEDGLEVNVYPVPAYSTLGWMNWAGGDPLLNTFISYPEGELARIIFHELAHQVVYASGDTMFNESFATSVERLGGNRWLQTDASPQVRKEYEDFDSRRRQFRALTLATRNALTQVYEEEPRAQRPALKARAMQDFRDQYAQLKASLGGYAGYDRFVAGANNASFGMQAAYDELVPGFEALFEREGRDWQRFYDAVKRLAALPKDQRHQALKETPRA